MKRSVRQLVCSRVRLAQLLLQCLACLACLASLAYAQSSAELERAKASFKAGAAAYAAGEYPAAIQALEQAYLLTPLPAIAFSLAQAERRQYFVDRDPAHLKRAVELFRRYLAQEPKGSRRADALDALSQLEPLAMNAGIQLQPSAPAAAPRAEAQTRIMVTSEAADARVALDDAEAAQAPLIREVLPGSHRVLVDAPGYFRGERTVTAIAGELVLSEVSLRERPSTLRINTSPQAELYLDGVFVSRGGRGVTLEQPSGKHTLTVAESGRRPQHRALVLRRGETVAFSVTLEPSRQRLVARSLFVGGAAALAAGVVLSGLTVRAEHRADHFLRQRMEGHATADGLRGYGAARHQRDGYRVATTLSLLLAGTAFCAAILTYVYDRPDASSIQRSTVPSKEASLTSTLRVEPTVSLQSMGGQLTTVF